MLLYLGLLVRARPELFSQLYTVRISHLIILLTGKLARAEQIAASEAYERVMAVPPSEVQRRLEDVLEEYHALDALPLELEQLSAEKSSPGELGWQPDVALVSMRSPTSGWLAWRQHQGVLDRRPAEFYSRIWKIFHHTPGLMIGNKWDKRNLLESGIVLGDMTAGEQSFALLVDHMLNHVPRAEYRQLTVEALNALASFFEQNPTLKIAEALAIDAISGHAVRQAYLEQYPDRQVTYSEHKSEAWDSFYARSPARTTSFLVAALKNLLTLRPA